jgi:hypothetical protein
VRNSASRKYCAWWQASYRSDSLQLVPAGISRTSASARSADQDGMSGQIKLPAPEQQDFSLRGKLRELHSHFAAEFEGFAKLFERETGKCSSRGRIFSMHRRSGLLWRLGFVLFAAFLLPSLRS